MTEMKKYKNINIVNAAIGADFDDDVDINIVNAAIGAAEDETVVVTFAECESITINGDRSPGLFAIDENGEILTNDCDGFEIGDFSVTFTINDDGESYSDVIAVIMSAELRRELALGRLRAELGEYDDNTVTIRTVDQRYGMEVVVDEGDVARLDDVSHVVDYSGNGYVIVDHITATQASLYDAEQYDQYDLVEYDFDYISGAADIIKPYTVKIPFAPIAAEGEAELFGVELELEFLSEEDKMAAARKINAWCGDHWAILKRDGSLDCGFEIVSQAMDYPHMREFLRNIARMAKKCGAVIGENGFHIHINRAAFRKEKDDAEEAAALIVDRLWPQLWKLSRRRAEDLRWCKNTLAGVDPWFKRRTAEEAARERDHESRYRAVNYTNEATIELRLFKASYDWRQLIAALQFARLLIILSNTVTPETVTWKIARLWARAYEFKEFLDKTKNIK